MSHLTKSKSSDVFVTQHNIVLASHHFILIREMCGNESLENSNPIKKQI